MLTDAQLELYARHLSLPEVGIPGQEKLVQAHVICMDHDAWANTFRTALSRAGVRVNDDAEGIAVVHDAKMPKNTVRFADGVHVGPVDFMHPTNVDQSGPLAAKHMWLGAALASEVMLWLLGHRPVRYWLSVEFPLLAVIDKA